MKRLLQSVLGLKVIDQPKEVTPNRGKAMPIHTRVKVPGGWKTLGELREGSPVVGPRGNIALVTQVLPQGVTDCYKFTFEDDREAFSHPLHLWEVFEGESSSTNVTTTLDIVAHFNEFDYFIPLVGEMSGTERRVGEEFIQEIATTLIGDKHTVDTDVQELHYHDRRNIAKTMRTYEGHVASNGLVKYITELKQSAINFQQLTWSVGGIASLQKIDGGYMVMARHRDIEQDETASYSSNRLKIVGISKDHPTETVCISLDSEDALFVVEDWIVTHNLCAN